MTTIPNKGDRHVCAKHSGYVLMQNRPRDCRGGLCRCGKCNGTSIEVELEVEQVIYWMDNSIEVVATDSDGRRWTDTLVAPHGDVC